ncbi:M64 family metallopeptidase [Sphingobacterium thalpophilum]|uniref:M64 family metallopeptidase n=1 Tax=Sphingobacterium thalpophilum TaxID=259 RepID=UPI002D76714E|nr:M64 family metallopeptidase [Sphingobacterium thalpophilum]
MNKHLLVLLIALLGIFGQAKAQSGIFRIDTLQFQGTDKHMVNLVIVGDGYTKEQLDDYAADARQFTNYFFSIEPFKQYSNFFNVFAIRTISAESGATHDCKASDCVHGETDLSKYPKRYNKFTRDHAVPVSHPNTIFGSSFDNGGLHRLVVPQKNDAIEAVLKTHVPNYTQVVVLVNSPFYGGSGGKWATSTVNFKSNDIAVHEIGHSFAQLADEYWAGNQYAIESVNRSQSADPNRVPWKYWLGKDGVGIYSYGGKGSPSNWFRPHEYCKMQYLIAPFCPVCQEQFVAAIKRKSSPFIAVRPVLNNVLQLDSVQKFALRLAKPSPNTFRTTWLLNNEVIARGRDSIYLDPGMMTVGENTLKVLVQDTTDLLRNPEYVNHRDSIVWRLNQKVALDLKPPLTAWADTLETCYGGDQVLSIRKPVVGVVYQWYDALSESLAGMGENISVQHLKTSRTYSVVALWKGKRSASSRVVLQTLPPLDKPKDIRVKIDKKKDVVRLSVNEKPEDRYNYIWLQADGSPIYEWDEFNGEYVRPTGRNDKLTLPWSKGIRKVYVQKVDRISTCKSELSEVTF